MIGPPGRIIDACCGTPPYRTVLARTSIDLVLYTCPFFFSLSLKKKLNDCKCIFLTFFTMRRAPTRRQVLGCTLYVNRASKGNALLCAKLDAVALSLFLAFY